MRTALSIYALVYAVATVVVVVDDFESKRPWLDKLFDVALMPLGLVGIMLFAFSIRGPGLRLLWGFIAPVIVVGLVANTVLGRYHALRASHIVPDEKMAGDVGTIVLLVPMFVVNLVYAFA